MRAYRLHLGEEALVYRLAYNGDVVAFKMGPRRDSAWHISTRFRNVWHGRDALPRDPRQHVRRSSRVQRLRWTMRSGASGVACLDECFAVLPCALASADCIRSFPILRLL